MKKIDVERSSIALFISAVTVSALTMVWMLWHFPIVTIMAALAVLIGVTLAARLAKTLDTESSTGGRDPKRAA